MMADTQSGQLDKSNQTIKTVHSFQENEKNMTSYQNWRYEIDGDHIMWLVIDRKDSNVNSLNREVMMEFNEILDDIASQPSITGVVISSAKSSSFIAGADIEQFVSLKDEGEAFELVRYAQTVFDKLAALKIPTVAAIKGFCLGGGLELVLACRYRIAENGPKTVIGAPEVKLGLHPGWGGTIRLPNLIGARSGLRMNVTGTPVDAKLAQKIGLVDVSVPERQLMRAARYYVLNKPKPQQPPFLDKILSLKAVRPWIAKLFYKALSNKKVQRRYYPAPYATIDNWVEFGTVGDRAMVQEAKSISQLMMTETSRNLVRLFFLQTRMKAQAKGVKFSVEHVHVAGAGTMGGDIAAWCVLQGMRVTLQDRTPEIIAPAIKRAHALFKKKCKEPRLVQAALDRLIPDVEGIGVSKADIVIEAISEDVAIKQAFYKAIEPKLKKNAILATNTSSLPLETLSQVLKQPGRLVGLHFFNPVAMMQLVEVVKGENTDEKIIAQATVFVRALDKLPLQVKSSPGFLINRVLMPYLMEAMHLLDEGFTAEDIDKAAVDIGMPMGPVTLADTVGLDVCLAVADILAGHYGETVSEKLRALAKKGNVGAKSGQGFYVWKKGKKVQHASPELSNPAMVKEIQDRLMLRMLNESRACLREGVIDDADLLDAGMIFGTGFAPFKGGPMHYAQRLGISHVVERLVELQKKYGERFAPDEGWLAQVKEEMRESDEELV
ncbi:MAG: enoyl-CoA hydratase [Gammaproteobacteria bacterium]|jgi:3-hydroxyacyl-CoA dehydrogenase/enoyl-CoA hydratase/3-hydroxybutyryl-CoA epimerase|nr:enoyl-CoA hydratase [Gammaproteobacteria bacterium]